jgi:hypothetical protein
MRIVHYTHLNYVPIVGLGASIYTTDHPLLNNDPLIPAHTTPVVAIDMGTGIIVTQNTVYVPVSSRLYLDWLTIE